MMEYYEGGIAAAVASVITAIITWLASRKKQRNDFIKDLQSNIDLLAEKNLELMQIIVTVREQNASLIEQVGTLKVSLSALQRENKQLSDEVQILTKQLEGVKTITRTK